MAATLKLPLLLIIEDNEFAISVKKDYQTPGGDITQNLASFGDLEIWSGSGTDPFETAELVTNAVSYVRSGKGAGLMRLKVPRLSGHSSQDNQAYKSEDRIAEEWAGDPLLALKSALVPKTLSQEAWVELERVVVRGRRSIAPTTLH